MRLDQGIESARRLFILSTSAGATPRDGHEQSAKLLDGRGDQDSALMVVSALASLEGQRAEPWKDLRVALAAFLQLVPAEGLE
jgi:hypothetical protein